MVFAALGISLLSVVASILLFCRCTRMAKELQKLRRLQAEADQDIIKLTDMNTEISAGIRKILDGSAMPAQVFGPSKN